MYIQARGLCADPSLILFSLLWCIMAVTQQTRPVQGVLGSPGVVLVYVKAESDCGIWVCMRDPLL